MKADRRVEEFVHFSENRSNRLVMNSIKQIQIIGSAPNAHLETCDFAYFANYSLIGYNYDEVREKCGCVNVFAASTALFPEYFNYDNLKLEKLLHLRKKILSFEPDEIIVFASKKKHIPELNKDKISYKILFPENVAAFYIKAAGHSAPFWEWRSFIDDSRKSYLKALKILKKTFIEYKKSDSRDNLHAYLRPSSGVTALAYAIKQHGAEAHYTLNGISFGARVQHTVSQGFQKSRNSFEPHVVADKIFVEKSRSLGWKISVNEA